MISSVFVVQFPFVGWVMVSLRGTVPPQARAVSSNVPVPHRESREPLPKHERY